MTHSIEAISRNGVFTPLGVIPGSIGDGQHVRLIVEFDGEAPRQDVLALAANVFADTREDERDAILAIALERRSFLNSGASYNE